MVYVKKWKRIKDMLNNFDSQFKVKDITKWIHNFHDYEQRVHANPKKGASGHPTEWFLYYIEQGLQRYHTGRCWKGDDYWTKKESKEYIIETIRINKHITDIDLNLKSVGIE